MKIDNRLAADIEEQIASLAGKYAPEWNFDRNNPDIGGVIAKIFAGQMKENIDLVNSVIERYHAEFINMLDLSLKPAKPAGSIVRFRLVDGPVPGSRIRKGTRLLADRTTAEGEAIVFETDREIYATNARIVNAFMTDREDSRITPLLGSIAIPEIVSSGMLPEEEGGTEEEELPAYATAASIRPFTLFSEGENVAQNVLILYHSSIFDIENEPIYIRISGNPDLNEKILAGDYVFRYYTDDGFVPFLSMKLLEDKETFCLVKDRENKKVLDGGKETAVVTLSTEEPVTEETDVTSISLSSQGHERGADYANDGANDLNPENFAPFGEELLVYNECYIGQDLYFSKGGARITISFRTSFKERGLYLTKQEEEVELKIVKKKPKIAAGTDPAHAYTDEISLEYFNGLGWKKLPCDQEVSGLFATDIAAEHTITFLCPEDWRPTETGAYSGRCLRLRLMKSDNCYLRPAVHHYPVIAGFQVSFSYGEHFAAPEKLFMISGTEKRDITVSSRKTRSFSVFSSGKYTDDALYLGFDRKLESGPVSLYFELDDVLNQSPLKCVFEYFSLQGFKQLRVLDYTYDFSRSGTVLFVPPADFHETELEGRRRFWLRIRRKHIQELEEKRMFLPRIRRILTNVVTVSNTITSPEEDYYLDEAVQNMHFPLHAENILDAEVWVNEKGSISQEEIEDYEANRPDEIREEFDRMERLTAVYILWKETDSFFKTKGDRRVYLIDRQMREIHFSDGIAADYPKVLDDVGFKVRIRTSNGEDGNVPEDSINETEGAELFIDTVTNPVRAYGGSDMETLDQALRRGANVMYGRNRLVSAKDYVFTILNFSSSIDKAACIPGRTIDGKENPADISFVLLMKDFADGSTSFHRIAGVLKNHLLESSCIAVSAERIHIVEPIFVSLTVNVWAEVANLDESFEIQSLIGKTLTEYLNPVSAPEHSGWGIGTMPKQSQIMMKLGTLKGHAAIRKLAMVVKFADQDGEHEMDLSDLKTTPFMVVRSGEHHVYINYR
ncbi:MAG: hypothetical protein K5985_11100 [Lachnospiraceae bacterium]|nr:hypothetical protein [Lachnospiraceae bacterium]